MDMPEASSSSRRMDAAMAQPLAAEERWNPDGIAYSICTLVTRPEQYRAMLDSFRAKGFTGPDVEFLYIDNQSANRYDGFSGLNLFLGVARGEFIIVCHQDVLIESDGRQVLDAVLADLERRDPSWALCGNTGGIHPGRLAIRISDPHGEDQRIEQLPCRVNSLDENFIVIKRRANLALSADLSGFHLYGADLCVVADILGHSAYVVDFHVRHLSGGAVDPSLARIKSDMVGKYARAFRSRWITASCAILHVSGARSLSRLLSSSWASRAARRFGWMVRGGREVGRGPQGQGRRR